MTLLSRLSRLGLVMRGLVRYQGLKGEFSKGPMMASCSNSVRMNLSTNGLESLWLMSGWLPLCPAVGYPCSLPENRIRALVPMSGPLTSADTFSMPAC